MMVKKQLFAAKGEKPMTVEALNAAHEAFHNTIKNSPYLNDEAKTLVLDYSSTYFNLFPKMVLDLSEDIEIMKHPDTVGKLADHLEDIQRHISESGLELSALEKTAVSGARTAAIEAAANVMGVPVPQKGFLL